MAIEINIDASAYVKKTELPSNLTLYPTNVASDISGYFKMVTNVDDPDYNDVAVDITTPSISGTGIEIARLSTTAGVLLGNPGIVNLTTLGNVRRVSGTSSATFNYEMYHRNSLGVETLIATSSMTANVDVNIYEQFSASAVLNNGDWIATDRIVIVYYGTKVGGGSNSVFEFQFGGTNPVRTIVPVPASVLLDVPVQNNVTKAVDFTSGSLLTNNGTEVTEIMPADLPISDATSERIKNFRSQDAGGVISIGVNIIVGDENNEIATDLGTSTIGGGGTINRENVIGGNTSTVNTGSPNVPELGTGADYSVITGGYDNVASGLMSVISGAHNYTKKESTHGTISGGSTHKIESGDYNVIAGGVQNSIAGGSNNSVGGGSVNSLPGTNSFRTISGGGTNVSTGTGSVIAGGTSNAANGNYSVVGGGFSNNAVAANSKIDTGGGNNTANGIGSSINGGSSNTTNGAISTIGGGENNTSGGDYSVISGGSNNKTIITYGVVGGGRYNESKKQFSTVGGGFTNLADGDYSSIAGGRSNSANGEGSAISGGYLNKTDGKYSQAGGYYAWSRLQGQKSQASGVFSELGDAQGSTFILRRQTTTNAYIQLRVDGSVGFLTIPSDTTWGFSGIVVGRRSDADNESAAYKIEGCIDNNAGTVALVGTPIITILGEDNASWDVTVTADNTNKCLAINCLGENGKTVRWVCKLDVAEVTG